MKPNDAPTQILEFTPAMRDSIEHTTFVDEAYVGSNDMKAVWQELGTSRGILPRSFLGGAARQKEHEVWEMTHRLMTTFMTGVLGCGRVSAWDQKRWPARSFDRAQPAACNAAAGRPELYAWGSIC